MFENVRIHFCPPEKDCLAWSGDGLLAIAAQEEVHVLIPNRRDEDSSSNVSESNPSTSSVSEPEQDQWDQVQFPINIFTKLEWPLQELAGSREFSIGEEQSMSEVISVGWSSPVLGRHRRCLLAVLTSNYLLSLWDPGPDPSIDRSWQRMVVINNCINYTTPDQSIDRARKRIKAAKWSSIEYEPSKFHHFLSVLNGSQEVVILRVQSNQNMLDLSARRLHVETICCASKELFEDNDCDDLGSEDTYFQQSNTNESSNDTTLLILPNRGRIEHDISWSSWEPQDESNLRWRSKIICRTNAKSRHLELECSLADGEPRVVITTSSGLKYTEGSIFWWNMRSTSRSSQMVGTAIVHGMRDSIVVRTTDWITHMGSQENWKFPLLVEAGGRKYRNWASVSGICASSSYTTPLLCVTTQQSDLVRLTVDLSLESTPKFSIIDSEKLSDLKTKLQACRQHFASEYDLDIAQVGLNIRGLASWKNEWIAMCVTLRAIDRVAYTTKGKERATVIFSHSKLEDGSASPSDTSQSSLIFPWKMPLPIIDSQSIRSKTLSSILDWPTTKSSIPDHLSRRILYNALCATMLFFTSHPFPNLPAMWDTKILPSLRLLGELRSTRYSERYTHSRYNIHLPDDDDDNDDDDNDDVGAEEENLASTFLVDLAPTWKHGGGEMKDTDTLEWLNNCVRSRSIAEKAMDASERVVETCSICGKILLWVSIGEAKCTNGHLWERCALTFLAIQAPGWSKYCERCEAQFHNEEFLRPSHAAEGESDDDYEEEEEEDDDDDEEDENEGDGSKELNEEDEEEVDENDVGGGKKEEAEDMEMETLAEYVFARFSVCIFCGGKFVSDVRGVDKDAFTFLGK